MTKYFIITIDTEEDNQWAEAKNSSTENSVFIPRFQSLSEEFGFIPVYLTTFGMALDRRFQQYIKPRFMSGRCEIGMHLHAWDTPPEYKLKISSENKSYLIEYPENIMREKIRTITALLEDTFDCRIVSHRAGRWAMDERYFHLLDEFGYQVDCSITPHINWNPMLGATGMPGSDYSRRSEKAYFISESLLEVPMTIRKAHVYEKNKVYSPKGFVKELKNVLTGKTLWFRPDNFMNERELMKMVEISKNDSSDYLMFMLHSSELMPGGSPKFPDQESIEQLYHLLARVFRSVSESFTGISLKDYYQLLKNREIVE